MIDLARPAPMTPASTSGTGASGPPSVSVAVVGICSGAHVTRCLDALDAQVGAPPFDIVVVNDPNIAGMEEAARRHPGVRFVANTDQRTPLELASRAMHESKGDLILLTEDHCIPRPDWVRTMVDAQAPGRAVVGGVVETDPDATPTDWAFYLVDFFRYMRPVKEGASPTLTVCNASYRREHLEAIRDIWSTFFHETAVNDALRDRFGDLWLSPHSEVRMRRTVRLRDAVYERYAFGRLFGCTRLEFVSPARRVYYTVFAPVLPVLLLGRMTRKAFARSSAHPIFFQALPALISMVLAWSLGEWLGYLTRRRPSSLIVAPEIRAARRSTVAPAT